MLTDSLPPDGTSSFETHPFRLPQSALSPSVTDIVFTVGFSQTSSFAVAFRKATGLTPTAYHRSLG